MTALAGVKYSNRPPLGTFPQTFFLRVYLVFYVRNNITFVHFTSSSAQIYPESGELLFLVFHFFSTFLYGGFIRVEGNPLRLRVSRATSRNLDIGTLGPAGCYGVAHRTKKHVHVVPIYNCAFRPRAGEHGSLILVGMVVRVSGRAPTRAT